MRRFSTFAPLALLALSACNNPAYYPGATRIVIDADDLAAAGEEEAANANPTIGAYAQAEYWLDFRPPSAAELDDLQPAGAMPAEQTPWVRRAELTMSVPWTLTNNSDNPMRAWVLLDGATEFYDYNPIAMYGQNGGEEEEEIQFPSLLGFTPIMVGPREVVRGEFREDDMREAMYDLDVLSRFCGGPLAVLYHRSEADPIGTEGVPDDAIIAGIVLLRLTLGADQPSTLEYAVRLRESEDIIYDSARDERRYEPMPQPYVLAAGGAGDTGGSGGAMDMCEDAGG
jgi:hypothetical protein